MNSRLKSSSIGILTLAMITGLPMAVAQADGHHGNIYVGATVGAGFQSDVSINEPSDGPREVSYEWAVAPDIKVGYDFGEIRVAMEVGYREFDVDEVSGNAVEPADRNQVFTGLVTGSYDIETGTDWTPYVGLGIGVMHVEGDVQYTTPAGARIIQDTSGTGVAGQISFGTAYKISDQLDLVGGYSYLHGNVSTADEDSIGIHTISAGAHVNF